MLKTRVITALILAGGLLAVLFLLPLAAAVAAFTLIVALGAWEWAGFLHARPSLRIAYAALTAGLCILMYFFAPPLLPTLLWAGALVFWLLLVPLWFRRKWSLGGQRSGWLVGWLLLLPAWAAMVELARQSAWLLLATMSVVWVADIAAYFAGRRWGRHKLAPAISPGKTWEGAAGALAGVCAWGLLLMGGAGWLSGPALVAMAVLGLVLATAVSIIGDLFESLAKRQAGVKDSSRLLPGHGGILDRIDSLTSTLPLAALALQLVLAHGR